MGGTMKSRNIRLVVIVAALAVHLAFYKLLKVPLPWGIVPVLY